MYSMIALLLSSTSFVCWTSQTLLCSVSSCRNWYTNRQQNTVTKKVGVETKKSIRAVQTKFLKGHRSQTTCSKFQKASQLVRKKADDWADRRLHDWVVQRTVALITLVFSSFANFICLAIFPLNIFVSLSPPCVSFNFSPSFYLLPFSPFFPQCFLLRWLLTTLLQLSFTFPIVRCEISKAMPVSAFLQLFFCSSACRGFSASTFLQVTVSTLLTNIHFLYITFSTFSYFPYLSLPFSTFLYLSNNHDLSKGGVKTAMPMSHIPTNRPTDQPCLHIFLLHSGRPPHLELSKHPLCLFPTSQCWSQQHRTSLRLEESISIRRLMFIPS